MSSPRSSWISRSCGGALALRSRRASVKPLAVVAAVAAWLVLASSTAFAQLLPIELDPFRSRGEPVESDTSPAPPLPPSPAPASNVDAASLLGGAEALSPAELPMFGEQLFRGGSTTPLPGFNPDYVLAV